MTGSMKAIAKKICVEYVVEAGLDDPEYKSWVPQSVRKKTADYALQWYQAVPIHGIIIGKSPSPYVGNADVAPKYAAGFSYDKNLWHTLCGERPPASADTMAHEISLSCHVDEQDVLIAIRDCWKLIKFGVICVNAVPLGREEDRSEKQQRNQELTTRDLQQMKTLAQSLSKLVCLSADSAGAGLTTVIAFGSEAQTCARMLEKSFWKSKTDHLDRYNSWKLKVHELYHPARTMWVFKKRKLPFLTMVKTSMTGKVEFKALCNLLARGSQFRPTPNIQEELVDESDNKIDESQLTDGVSTSNSLQSSIDTYEICSALHGMRVNNINKNNKSSQTYDQSVHALPSSTPDALHGLRLGSINNKNKNKKSSQNHNQSVWACSSSAPNTSTLTQLPGPAKHRDYVNH
jgi:hypothetical protein